MVTNQPSIMNSGPPLRRHRLYFPAATRSGMWVFGALFGLLAAIEVTLYVTGNIYTRKEQAARQREAMLRTLPSEVAKASDRSSAFDARLTQFASSWHDATGVPLESLSGNPALSPPIRDLLADTAAGTAAECWGRLRDQSTAYRELPTLRSRLQNIGQRVGPGTVSGEDADFVTATLLKLDQWSTELDAHERCLQHIKDLLRVRSLAPGAGARPGGTP